MKEDQNMVSGRNYDRFSDKKTTKLSMSTLCQDILLDSAFLRQRIDAQGPYNSVKLYLTDWGVLNDFSGTQKNSDDDENGYWSYASLHQVMTSCLGDALHSTLDFINYQMNQKMMAEDSNDGGHLAAVGGGKRSS
eukprot:10706179-Ditylum_brightwellii.AAC.1